MRPFYSLPAFPGAPQDPRARSAPRWISRIVVALGALIGLSAAAAAQTGFAPAGVSSAVGVTCPMGSTSQTQQFVSCFPADCASVTGSITNQSLLIPKFDPSQGKLIQVEVFLRSHLEGSACLDNDLNACCPSMSYNIFGASTLEPSPGNVPAVVMNQISLDSVITDGPAGGLAADDGDGPLNIDCSGTLTGCAGNDSFTNSFMGDEDSIPTVFSTDPAIRPFIACPGEPANVEFLSGLISSSAASGCGLLDFNAQVFGRVEAVVTYTYCTNVAPTCSGQTVDTTENAFVDINVLQGAEDPEGRLDCGSVSIVSQPPGSTIDFIGCSTPADPCPPGPTGNCNGCVLRYTPPLDVCGPQEVMYTVSDLDGATSNPCTITIQVMGINEPPVAVDDTATTMEDTVVRIPVCANDFDPDDGTNCGAPLDCNPPGVVTVVTQPDCGGTAVANPNGGGVTFTPPPGFCGVCRFRYTVVDTAGLVSNEATVSVLVTGINDCPVANDDTATTPEDTFVDIDVCGNDTDPDLPGCGAQIDCCTVTVTSPPSCGGMVVPTPGVCGSFRFTPPANYCGPCTFRYTVADAAGCVSNEATVTIDVTPVNDCPTANDDVATTPEDTAAVIDVCANDVDPDDRNGCGGLLDCCTVMVTSPPTCGGTLVPTPGQCGRFTFTPPADFCGTCSFRYVVSDTDGCVSNEATVTITVTPVNDCPVANDDSATTPEETPVVIDVCMNDFDPDEANGCGAPLDCCTVMVTAPPNCGGTVVPTPGQCGRFTFTPPADFCGTCTFRYTVQDTDGCVSNMATVTVTVTGVNTCPVANDDMATTNEDTEVIIDVCANDFDPDTPECGGELDCCSVQVTAPPTCGVVLPGPTCGTFRFTPNPNFCGTCTFRYVVSDAERCISNEATVTVVVEPVNDPPIANDDSATTEQEMAVVIDLCANDTDPDDKNGCGAPIDCCTIEITSPPDCGGTVIPNCDGTATFTPPMGFCGAECTFRYRLFDTDGLPSNEATVTVFVNCPFCDTPNRRNPGSLLLYPEFDNRVGIKTLLTVTYVGGSGAPTETAIEFVYKDEDGCLEFNRTETLTQNDTLSLITRNHNPNMERGYVYAFTKCSENGPPAVNNRLIGNLMVIDGFEIFSFSVNPLVFKGIGMNPDTGEMGEPCLTNGLVKTDLDGDGIRDLDGIEYEMAPDQIQIPRFLGQNDLIQSDLILIALSGMPTWDTTVDFLVYNDNEQAFSTEYVFDCWTRVPLTQISPLFSTDFLKLGTDQDPDEVLGDPATEAGWMRIDGDVAQGYGGMPPIHDPAFYAVLVESVAVDRFVADLPFERCTQDNGELR